MAMRSPVGSQVRVWATLFGREAVRALFRHKLRSLLAALGIMIGIAAVILVVAIGKAGSERAEAQLQNLGDNLVWVEAGSRNVNGVRTGTHGTTSLTMDDAEAILREVPLITRVSPQVDSNAQVIYGDQNWNTKYRGVSPEFLDIKRWPLAEGVSFTDEDVRHAANVCLLGQTVREKLFGAANPVGQSLRIGIHPFVVIGLLEPKGPSATGQDQDDTVLMPYTTAQKKLRGKGFTWVDDIMCSAASSQTVAAATAQIVGLLRQRHQIRPDGEDDFNIRRPDELIKAQIEQSQTLALLLVSVASISLLVGGIGIMNVMLASVTQRTREIGLRLAVGAQQSAVQMQFLGEAVMLTLLGGLLGILLGVGGTYVFGRVLEWPISIPPAGIAIAFGFSIGVGIFFGFYPARRAARLDPITALRYE
ncbi:MAG TPA: ABC transporter permease [Polyangia bacterium]|nr:ABC transporter permease [Polyangia bacterium]